jgi:ABC-type lipopolysaccharide export system ATPase subunit
LSADVATAPRSDVPPAPLGDGLAAEGLVRYYGKWRVVSDVTIQVRRGEIVGLLGPNGAGKTTSFYMIVGLLRPNEGRILLDGKNITDEPVYRRARMGLGYLAQEPSIFRRLTVREKILAVLETMPDTRAQSAARFNILHDIRSYAEIHAETAELTRFLGLQGIEEIEAGELSYGGQRLVDLGIELGSKPTTTPPTG